MHPLTCSCFLLLLGRLSLLALPFLLGTCLCSPWSPPFPLHALTLISLSLTKMQLSLTLTLFPLTIWYSRLMALFLFLLARAALAYLSTAPSVALRSLFPFQQTQYVQVSLWKPVPFCKLFAGLGSTNKSAISHLFSSCLTLFCSLLHLSFYLKLSGRSGRNCLFSPPVLSGFNGCLDICFSQGTVQLMSWPDGECYLCPLQFLVVSLLLSLIPTLSLFSDWRRIVSSKFFNTQVSSISTKELVLPHQACCVLSCLHCNKHSLLLSS